MAVGPTNLLIELLGDNLESCRVEPRQDPVATGVVVIAADIALDHLAADDRVVAAERRIVGIVDRCLVDLLDREVEVTAGPDRPPKVILAPSLCSGAPGLRGLRTRA